MRITDYADAFARTWARPTPDGLAALLHPDVLLLQPHRPPVRGRDAALREFRRLFTWLPGLHGAVTRAICRDDTVFIEWRMIVPTGGDPIVIGAVDRFLLRDELGIERAVYFDQLEMMRAVARHPALWRGYLRYRLEL